MKQEYIFIPKEIENILDKYPCLSKNIPINEGAPSKGFSKARKSQRQIYRVLSNQHYDNLVKLLENIEICLLNGYTNIDLLKEKDTGNFSSAISEVQIASSLISKDFIVEGFDQCKGTESVPDIQASNENISFIAEIYKPRDFDGLNLLVDDIRLYLKYLDVPLDYKSRIDYKQITLGSFLNPSSLDLWGFSKNMENKKHRLKLEKEIFSYIDKRLKKKCLTTVTKEFKFEKYNLLIKIDIKHIRKAKNDYPSRFISYFPPPFSDYAPEGMFDQLVKKKVLKKIRKGQMHTILGKHLRVLIVDISSLIYADTGEFDHFVYLPKFKDTLDQYFVNQEVDVDIVAFCMPSYSNKINVKLVYKKKGIDNSILHDIFGTIEADKIVQ